MNNKAYHRVQNNQMMTIDLNGSLIGCANTTVHVCSIIMRVTCFDIFKFLYRNEVHSDCVNYPVTDLPALPLPTMTAVSPRKQPNSNTFS